MGALLNPRWERFCQAVASGLSARAAGYSQAKAYESAGYTTTGHASEVAASRLLRHVEPVIQRIQELQAENHKASKVTVDSVTRRLDVASRIAEEDRMPAAIVAAEAAKAKIHGLTIDRTEQGKPGDFSQAQSAEDIADAYLRAHNPQLREISEEQRELALGALSRLDAELSAIAHAQAAQGRAS